VIREYAGLLVLDLVFLASGTGVLHGLGLATDRRAALRWSGLSFTVGWGLYGVVATFALTAGSPLGVAIDLGICVAVGIAGLVLGSRVPRTAAPFLDRPTSERSWVAVGFGTLLCAYMAVLCWRSVPGEADTSWDSWAFWLPKAKSIYYFHGLDNGPGGFTHFANRDYPPLGPALEATNFDFMGRVVAAPLQFQHWLVAVAFFGALAALLARRVPGVILWPGLAAIAFMPRFGDYLGSSLPDEEIGMLIALVAVCAALWLLERQPAYAALMIVLSTAATLLKNEGLLFALAAVAVVVIVAWREGRRALALGLVVVPIASLAPWKAWLLVHGLRASSQYYGVNDLGPAHLLASRDRLGTSIVQLTEYLGSPSRWLLVVPLAGVAAAVAVRRQPVLAWLVGVFVVASMSGLVLIYWIGNIPLDFWLVTSGERTVMAIVMACGALLPLLVAESMRRRSSL
jgi:hypothetical protein